MTKKAKSTKKAREGRGARATERRVAHAVIHPIRLDVLSILFERMASPKELAEMLQQPLATVSFHVGELKIDEAIELVKTEPRRGAVEHFYRAKSRPEISDEELKALPEATRRKLAAVILQAIVAEGLASLRHGRMDTDDDLNLIWMPMRLDAAGQREVSDLQAEMFERLDAIKADSEERQPIEGIEGPPVRIAAVMWFERGRPDALPSGDAIGIGIDER